MGNCILSIVIVIWLQKAIFVSLQDGGIKGFGSWWNPIMLKRKDPPCLPRYHLSGMTKRIEVSWSQPTVVKRTSQIIKLQEAMESIAFPDKILFLDPIIL